MLKSHDLASVWSVVGAVVLLSSCGVARQPAARPRDAVVLVGAVDVFDRVRTHQSGFVVRRSERHYVVTSRHGIAQGSERGARSWFAIARPQKTKPAPSARLSLGEPSFHARDTDAATYDIAVLPLLNEDSPTTRPVLREIALDVGRLTAEKLVEGQPVTAIGYPAAYADLELNGNATDRLWPLACAGTISHDSRALNSSQSGFTAPLVDFHFAATRQPCLGEGASGGVIVANADTMPRPVGMLVGSRNFPPTGFVFTDMRFVLETLVSIANR